MSAAVERIPAAIVERLGGVPRRGVVDPPRRGPGQALLEVTAAALNPLDLLIAGGRFHAGAPQLPYVPGKEGVGRVLEADGLPAGARVWFETPGGVGGDGALAALAVADEARTLPVPDGVDDAVAVSIGIAGMAAWLALAWRAALRPGERVLVLGATGVVGSIAVQAAKLLGAGRVVAAGRNRAVLERTRALGADAIVPVDDGDLAAAIREAAGGEVDVTVDALFGEPMLAAARASSRGARIVQLGESAAPEIALRSDLVRGRMLEILGLSHFGVPDAAKADAYRELTAHAAAGRIAVDVEERPLERVADLWRVQAGSPNRKLVLVP